MGYARRVRAVLDAMRRLDLAELEVRIGDERVAVRRPELRTAGAGPALAPTAIPPTRTSAFRHSGHVTAGRHLLRLAAAGC